MCAVDTAVCVVVGTEAYVCDQLPKLPEEPPPHSPSGIPCSCYGRCALVFLCPFDVCDSAGFNCCNNPFYKFSAKSREMTEFTRVLFPVHMYIVLSSFPVLWPELQTCLVVIQISDSCYGRRAFLCPFGVCDSAGGTLLSRGFPLGGDFGRRDDGVVTCSAFISATKPGS